MSDPVTIQQLIDAGLDVDTIEQVTMNNGYTGDTTTNRDGVTIDTLEGRLKRLGFDVPIAYAGAISFAANDRTKTISYSGNIYAPRVEDLPFTTSGTWVGDDEDKFYSVQLSEVPINGVDTVNIVDEAVTTAKLDTTLQGKITNVGNLVTLSGVAADSTGLGTFTGSTIPDDSTNKEALQALETALEGAVAPAVFSGYLFGIDTSSSDGDTVDVTAGKCADSTGTAIITVSSGSPDIKNRISASGNLAGAASPSADTTYYLFVVSEADGTNPRFAFDSSLTATNALSEWSTETGETYTLYRLIGFALTDSTPDIIAFQHTGSRWRLKTTTRDYTAASSTTRVSAAVSSVPSGVVVSPSSFLAVIYNTFGSSGTDFILVTDLYQDDLTPSASIYTIVLDEATPISASYPSNTISLESFLTNTSKQIGIRATSTDLLIRITTSGWVYER